MRLLTIHLERFRLHADTRIDFPAEGTFALIGSNEAGKSSVLEGLTWALFGAAALRGSAKSIRWNRSPAKRTASVTLRFAILDRVYRIERSESGAKVFDETDGSCVADGVAPVNQFVPTLIGMTLGEFASSYLCAQKDVARLATMKPTERVAFVRKLLGVEQIDTALKSIRARRSELGHEIDGLGAGLGERGPLESAVKDAGTAERDAAMQASVSGVTVRRLEKEHGVAVDAVQHSRGNRALHEKAAAEATSALVAFQNAEAEIGRLTVDVTGAEAASNRLRDAGDVTGELTALRGQRDNLVQARAQQSELAALDRQVRDLVAEIPPLRESIRDAERVVALFDAEQLEAAKREATATGRRFEDVRDARLAALADAKAARKAAALNAEQWGVKLARIRALGTDGECPTCMRELAEQLDVVIAAAESDMARSAEEFRAADATAQGLADSDDDEDEALSLAQTASAEIGRLENLRADGVIAQRNLARDRAALDKATAALERAEARRTQLSAVHFDADRLHEVEAEIKTLEVRDRAMSADRGLATRLGGLQGLLVSARQAARSAEAAVREAEAVVVGIGFSQAAHERLEADAEQASGALQAARVALARAEESERGARARLEAGVRSLHAYDERAGRLEQLRAEHLTYERTDARMQEFRVAIASTIRPELEELCSGFVALLTDGRHEAVTLNEEFGMTLYESGVPIEVVSGGCEDVAALAMRLALSQLIAQRAGHQIECLILDEPFGSLDEIRRGNVLSLLRRLGKVFPQMVVISHVAETRDAVDQVVELEHDESAGLTRVVGAAVAIEAA